MRAAAHGVDWTRFGLVVNRQRIAGLVEAALGAARLAPPADVSAPIARAARLIVQRNLAAAAETARLADLLAGAGHPVLAVKGVVLGTLAYGSIALKHSKDIDLLILPEHADAVITLLEHDGYRLTLPATRLSAAQRRVLPAYGKDVALRKPGGSAQIELHWRLFDSRALLPGITARAPAQRVALGGGRSVPTLAQPALYAYLAMHGATDGWSRLKWLADLNALLAPLDDAAVAALHESAVALGAGAASAQALMLIRDMFGRDVARDLAASSAPSRRVALLVAGAYRMMAPQDGARETSTWWRGQLLALAMQPLLAPNARHFAQMLRSVLYLPQAMYASRLPPALYALYPLIRVPSWMVRRARFAVAKVSARGKSATISGKSS